MKILVRSVLSGFGFSLGAALFKKVSKHVGLEDKPSKKTDPDIADDGEVEEAETEPVH